jgi:hypothetical protein
VLTPEVGSRVFFRIQDGAGHDTVHEMPPPEVWAASSLQAEALSSIVEYLRQNRDGLDLETLTIFAGHDSAVVYSAPLGERKQRVVHILAQHREPVVHSANQMSPEEAIIYLSSAFVRDANVDLLIKLFSNVKTGAVLQAEDDGVAQTVTAKVGPGLQLTTPVPNPVVLRPYRTFREIEQPETPFILRATSNGADKLPSFRLIAVQDGKWKLDAAESVAEFLRKGLAGETITAGVGDGPTLAKIPAIDVPVLL